MVRASHSVVLALVLSCGCAPDASNAKRADELDDNPVGRFVIVKADNNALWVTDTRFGNTKLCRPNEENQTPTCRASVDN
jgi:hypothetical protein